MAGRKDQIPKLQAAADQLTEWQEAVLPRGFRMQQVTVHILNDPDNPEGGYASADFTWTDGAYQFTVS